MHCEQPGIFLPGCFAFYFKKILLYYFYILNNIHSFAGETYNPYI